MPPTSPIHAKRANFVAVVLRRSALSTAEAFGAPSSLDPLHDPARCGLRAEMNSFLPRIRIVLSNHRNMGVGHAFLAFPWWEEAKRRWRGLLPSPGRPPSSMSSGQAASPTRKAVLKWRPEKRLAIVTVS